MNSIDLLIILVVLLCTWTAYRRGFILSVLVLLSWMVVLAVALLLYKPAGALIMKWLPKAANWSPALAFILIMVLTQIAFDRLTIWLLDRLPQQASQSRLNHWLGVLPGLVNGYIWSTLLAAFLVAYPQNNSFTHHARESGMVKRLAGNVGWLNERLSPVFTDALLQLRGNTLAAVSHERMTTLPFKVATAKPRPDLEAELLRLVNRERTQRGLQPLQPDAELTKVARKHSEDMFRRGYFSHYTPEGLDPFDRMKNDGVDFLTGGENIAITQTLSMAHTGLMKSPGHRANILNPAFGRLGIGILDGGLYGLMITQAFRN